MKTATNYDALLPDGLIFNLKDIETMGLVKVSTMKKIIAKKEIQTIKIRSKLHISRSALIEYLEKHTIEAIN